MFDSPTMAAVAVDVGYLAASYAVPETNLQSLLSAPTIDLVQSLLVQLEAKAHEHDELRSEKLRSDVELEAAVHDADSRTRTLKATTDKAVKEAEELRQQLAQKGKCATMPLSACYILIESQKRLGSSLKHSCRHYKLP